MRAEISLVVLALGATVACGEPPAKGQAADPNMAPALTAVTLDGDSVALEDLRGQVVLLNVWATWCIPCRKEAPELQEVYEAHRSDGLRVLGVTVDNRGAEARIREFVEEYGMTYDIWWDPDGSAIPAFGAVGVPLTVLIDRDGRVVWRHLGTFHSDDAVLRSTLADVL